VVRASEQSPEGPRVEVLYQAIDIVWRNVISGRGAQREVMQVGTPGLVVKPMKDFAVVCIGPLLERTLEDRQEFIRR
jgi:hypothetical protein